MVICQRREALLVAEELVEQLRRRRGEQREQERRHREQPEARPVPGHADLGVGGVVAAALGQVPGRQADERAAAGPTRPSRGATRRSPMSASGSAMRQSPAPNAPAAASSENANARDPDGISSAATMPTSTPPAVAAPRTSVCATPSDTRSGDSAGQRGEDAAGRRADEQHAPSPAPVGERRHDERAEHADAHQRQHRALVGLAGVELVGRERDRLREQRADEPEDAARGSRAVPSAVQPRRSGASGGDHHGVWPGRRSPGESAIR